MRKTRIVTIDADNRDRGKKFLITEMDVFSIDMWGLRALNAMAVGGLEISEETKQAGIKGVFALGFESLLKAPINLLEPLWKEMLTCIQVHTKTIDRALIDGDIEEISTLWKLRMEIFDLHVGFLRGESPSTSQEEIPATTLNAPITRMLQS